MGFECDSISGLNNGRQQHQDCVTEGSDKTGSTAQVCHVANSTCLAMPFPHRTLSRRRLLHIPHIITHQIALHWVGSFGDHAASCQAFIEFGINHRPAILFGENVKGLLNKTPSGETHAVIMMKKLNAAGYICTVRRTNSNTWGSPQDRPRVYAHGDIQNTTHTLLHMRMTHIGLTCATFYDNARSRGISLQFAFLPNRSTRQQRGLSGQHGYWISRSPLITEPGLFGHGGV